MRFDEYKTIPPIFGEHQNNNVLHIVDLYKIETFLVKMRSGRINNKIEQV